MERWSVWPVKMRETQEDGAEPLVRLRCNNPCAGHMLYGGKPDNYGPGSGRD